MPTTASAVPLRAATTCEHGRVSAGIEEANNPGRHASYLCGGCDREAAVERGLVEREFTEFVAARGHALLPAAYALTGDQHAAEDLVQGALAKAYVHWREIRG